MVLVTVEVAESHSSQPVAYDLCGSHCVSEKCPLSPLPHSRAPGSSLVGFLKQELASGFRSVP